MLNHSQQIPGIPAWFRCILARLVLTQTFKNGLTAHARVNSSPDCSGSMSLECLDLLFWQIAILGWHFLPELAVSLFFSITEKLVGGFNNLEKYEFVNGKDDIPYIYI